MLRPVCFCMVCTKSFFINFHNYVLSTVDKCAPVRYNSHIAAEKILQLQSNHIVERKIFV